MITADSAELVQDASLVRSTGALITSVDFSQILPFAGLTHVRCLGNHELESTKSQTPRPAPRLGNIYPESTRSLRRRLNFLVSSGGILISSAAQTKGIWDPFQTIQSDSIRMKKLLTVLCCMAGV